MSESLLDPSCPLPIADYPRVLLAHGGGGKLMQQLIDKIFLRAFGSTDAPLADAAELHVDSKRQAFTTDSYVVSPLFFPGGNIGKLAVYGTVNDLATSGARPRYLSAAFILEEGLDMEVLWRVAVSMAEAARECGVSIVTGDTKVVERGNADGLYVNTTGVGTIEHALKIGPASILTGDAVIVTGDLARHGAAIMAARESLGFSSTIASDCAPLHRPILDLIDAGVELHCVRDLTRGGLASVLNELAVASNLSIELDGDKLAVAPEVAALCEVLGLDPLHVANEGRMVLFVPENHTDRAVGVLGRSGVTENSAIVGRVLDDRRALVSVKSGSGASRILPMLSGEQLPRIC